MGAKKLVKTTISPKKYLNFWFAAVNIALLTKNFVASGLPVICKQITNANRIVRIQNPPVSRRPVQSRYLAFTVLFTV